MKENAVKAKLKRGEHVFGMLSGVFDPQIVETVALLGFDCYMLDCEHGAGGTTDAETFVRTCEAAGITPLARVRSIDPKLILQFLDAGMMGIMMPGIHEAEEVEQLVAAIKYPPLGKRGMAPVRANDYLLGKMKAEDYVKFANEQILILPQIELIEAVNNLDSLLRVEGVDGYFVGPRDLSVSMGFYDGPGHDEVRTVINDVFSRVQAAGLLTGTVAPTGQDAHGLIERRVGLLLTSPGHLLKAGANAFFSAAKG
ncbi:MAG TPA: aldolase/citrate lyase family protein [Chloroflexia bacterium]|nr:aldolase/citrate lyase family protein [Chloroflexia bacterium]